MKLCFKKVFREFLLVHMSEKQQGLQSEHTSTVQYCIFKFEVDLGKETPSVGFDILWEFESV